MGSRSDYVKTPLMEKRKSRIKDTARTMIVAQGIARTTMKDIAAACGIGRKTLYRFFGDIEDIAKEIMADIAASPESFTATYRPQGESCPDQLRHAAHAWLQWCLGHEEVMRFYYEYDYHFREPHHEPLHDFWKRKPNVFEHILREGQANGSFLLPSQKVSLVGFTIPNTIIATVHRVLLRQEVYRVEYGYACQDIAEMVDMLLAGLCGPRQGNDLPVITACGQS